MTDFLTTPITADLVRGCLETEQTADGLLPHRLPAWARAQNTDPQLAMVEAQPSGVRLAFRSRATRIELHTMPTKRVFVGAPQRPDGVYGFVIDGKRVGHGSVAGGRTMTVDMSTGSVTTESGPAGSVCFQGLASDMKDIEIWLPHDEIAEQLMVLRTDAPVEPAGLKPRSTDGQDAVR